MQFSNRRIREHDIAQKLPDNRSAQSAMKKLDFADKQIDPGRIFAIRIFLDVPDWRVFKNDDEASHIFLAIDARRVLRDYLIE